MDRARLMAMVEELGAVFAARSMRRHVEELRLYWLGLVRGSPVTNRRGEVSWWWSGFACCGSRRTRTTIRSGRRRAPARAVPHRRVTRWR